MWNAGESASAIAAVLNGKSRNAVIGKLNRLGDLGGVQARAKPRAPRRAVAPKPAPKRPAVKREPVERDDLIPPAPTPLKGKVTLETVGNRQCRFPMGDPRQGSQMPMCGQKTEEGRPYCDAHRRVTTRNHLAWGEAR
jgi:hypothetical protein